MNNKRKTISSLPSDVASKKQKTIETFEKIDDKRILLDELTKVRDLAFASLKDSREQIEKLKNDKVETEKKCFDILTAAKIKIDTLQTENKELEENARMLEEETFRANQMEDKLEIKEREIEELKETLKSQNVNLNYNKIVKDLNALEAKCKTHKSAADFNKLLNENETLKTKSQNVNLNYNKILKDLNALEAKCKTHKSAADFNKLLKENETLRTNVATKYMPIGEYNRMKKEMENLKANIQKNFNERNFKPIAEYNMLISTLKSKEEEYQRKEAVYKICNDEMKDFATMIEEQSKKQKKDELRITNLLKENKNAQSSLQRFKEDNGKLKSLEGEVKVLKFQNEKLQKDKTDLLSQSKLDKDENTNLEQEREMLETANSRLKLDNTDLQHQVKLQKEASKQMTAEDEAMTSSLDSLNERIESLESTNFNLEEQNYQQIKSLIELTELKQNDQELISKLKIDLEEKSKKYKKICSQNEEVKLKLNASKELVADLKCDLKYRDEKLEEKTDKLKSKQHDFKSLVLSHKSELAKKDEEIREFQNSSKKYETELEQINAKLKKKKSQIKKLEHKNYEKKRMLKKCHQNYEGKYKELTDKHKATMAVLKKSQEWHKKKTGKEDEKVEGKSQDFSEIHSLPENTFSKNTLSEKMSVHVDDLLLSSEDDEENVLFNAEPINYKEVVTAQNKEIIGDLLDDILSKIVIVNTHAETQEMESLNKEVLTHQDDDELLVL